MTDHSTHGRDSPEETPNLTHCPCVGHGFDIQRVCADAGCGYCGLVTETPDEIAQKLVMFVGRKEAMALCAIARSAVDNSKAVEEGVTGPKPDYEVDPLVSMVRTGFGYPGLKEAAQRFLEWFETYDLDQGERFNDDGGREARDALKAALIQEPAPLPTNKKDLHHRLTELTDWLLGPVPTMPIDGLVTRLEEAVPRLLKAIEAYEGEDTDIPIYFAALAAMVADVHAPQDLLTQEQWERAEVLFNEMNTPKGPACPVCRGRKVVQGAFETPCHNCKGTGVSPQIPRYAWRGYPLGECCIAGRCDGGRCECPCHPKQEAEAEEDSGPVRDAFTPEVKGWEVNVIATENVIKTVFSVGVQHFVLAEAKQGDDGGKERCEFIKRMFLKALEERDKIIFGPHNEETTWVCLKCGLVQPDSYDSDCDRCHSSAMVTKDRAPWLVDLMKRSGIPEVLPRAKPDAPPKAESSVHVMTKLSGSARKVKELGLPEAQEKMLIGLLAEMGNVAFDEGYGVGDADGN